MEACKGDDVWETKENLPKENNLLETVFKDGKLLKEQSLAEIRNKLSDGEF